MTRIPKIVTRSKWRRVKGTSELPETSQREEVKQNKHTPEESFMTACRELPFDLACPSTVSELFEHLRYGYGSKLNHKTREPQVFKANLPTAIFRHGI